LKLVLAALVALLVITIFGREALIFWLNSQEFGELFLRPIVFQLVGGVILATIVLVRLDFRRRNSILWWLLRLILRLIREKGESEYVPATHFDFGAFRMAPANFALWPATKVLVATALFENLLFGMAVFSAANGWQSGLQEISKIFFLPFVTPPFDMNFARENVLPAFPALTMLISPIISAIGVRLVLLVGISNIIKLVSPRVSETTSESARRRIAVIEGLVGLALLWAAVASFFPSNIDYNTRWMIGGMIAAGSTLTVFAALDRSRARMPQLISSRPIFIRLGAVLIIALVAGSIMAVNNSRADAQKIELLGPYVTQQISINSNISRFWIGFDSGIGTQALLNLNLKLA
jgi:hypothetical protein